MCGIFGVFHKETSVFQALIDGITLLQHRGQDSAGIATLFENRHLYIHKNNGTVHDVFSSGNVLKGNIGIGHVRYSTTGSTNALEAHPFLCYDEGIALVHNGNITNTAELKSAVGVVGRNIQTESDSELLLHLFAIQFFEKGDIFESVAHLMRHCMGGFSVLLLIRGKGLVAFRDPFGIRPLCFGQKNGDYAFASESIAIDSLDPEFKLVRDIHPGECVFIDMSGNITSRIVASSPSLKPCIFEYIYFSRADSILDGISVYDARVNMGVVLAQKIRREQLPIDVVIPVPETSRISALEIAYCLNLPYREGFVKNRYIARTFILPGQESREKTVRLKLNTISSIFKNKNVLIVDDSIVRGTTAKQIVHLARLAQANKVFFASASPPVLYPNIYGIHIPTKEELVAYQKTHVEIGYSIGADAIIYNDLTDVIKSCILPEFETSCFDGHYISGSPL